MSSDVELTPRQRQVVALLGEGLDYQQVADELGLAYRTVTDHARNAAQRLPGDQRPMQKLMLHSQKVDADVTPG